MGAEDRIVELGLEIPPPAAPVASYVPVVVAAGMAFVSGQVPLEGGQPVYRGAVGSEVSLEEATDGARRCALQILAALRAELGSLDRVVRIVRVGVFVASAPGFHDQSKVANGASDLFVEVFGDAGKHARAAVGVAELPLGVPVEVEAVAEIQPELVAEIEAELKATALAEAEDERELEPAVSRQWVADGAGSGDGHAGPAG